MIEGKLQIGRRIIPVKLRDISLLGFGIDLPSDVLARQAPGRKMVLSLPLGPGGLSLRYPVVLRHHALATRDAPPRLGLKLDPTKWDDNDAQQALQTFVMDRQRSVCRRRPTKNLRQVA